MRDLSLLATGMNSRACVVDDRCPFGFLFENQTLTSESTSLGPQRQFQSLPQLLQVVPSVLVGLWRWAVSAASMPAVIWLQTEAIVEHICRK